MDVIALKEPAGRFALRSALPTISEESERTWIHVAVEGSWKGHPAGDFELTRDVFGEVIRNFNESSNPIPLTYGHPRGIEGDHTGAAGWIHELELRKDGLWAFTEFTDRAAEQVKAGEHRFCSIVLELDSVDRRTGRRIGAELHEVGLVLSPFLDELNEIRLSAREAAPEERELMDENEMPPEGESEAPAAGKADAAVDRIVEEISAMGGDADATALIAFMETAAPAFAQLFMSETDEGEAAEEAATLSRRPTGVRAAARRIGELELSHRLRDVRDALRLGHILEADREEYERLAETDPELLKRDLARAAKRPAVPTGQVYRPTTQRPEASRQGLTTQEREAADVRDLSSRQQKFYQARRALRATHSDALKWARERA